MRDYTFYILIAYSFCFISLSLLIYLSKLYLSNSQKKIKEIDKND